MSSITAPADTAQRETPAPVPTSAPGTAEEVPHRGLLMLAIMLATIMQVLDTTICSMEVAMPHRAEVSVKPPTENRKMFLRPKRPASQAVGRVMMAEATM